ncbi:TIGR03618 family F420-dependent PPOX class oxidoreductase [Micromonospora terminaliae]|uniref:PPOX class F420-dependent oxidoreductase n=2 Tax=Micromonospora terminaliae TaxID=1914461 RepID=A0AAJ2ZI55_9ACTN|nr:PPOX class F420-dependent oxidoreductase [Micromonospora terminaliae]QGL51265.1 TIGR03618 family F420-dependent PPOX class oxidoreductase [Micromonospora terminaliae]
MSDDQWRAFVTAGTRTGKLATVRADGSPHVVPVWFVLDGDDLIFNTGSSSVKGRNLVRDPRAALTVDEEQPPYAFVTVRGTVTIIDDPVESLPWSTRIAARYMGADRADEYGRRNAVPGELLVRLRAEQVVAFAGIAD